MSVAVSIVVCGMEDEETEERKGEKIHEASYAFQPHLKEKLNTYTGVSGKDQVDQQCPTGVRVVPGDTSQVFSR